MPADLDKLQSFLDAITGAQIGLARPDGSTAVLTREDLSETISELAQAREDAALAADRNAYQEAVVADLGAYLVALEKAAPDMVDPRLVRIINQSEEPEHDPGLVDVVVAGVAHLGLEIRAESATALLDLIEAYVNAQSSNGVHPEEPTQMLTQAQAPPPEAEVHELRIPRPANPPPFKEVTAEDLFGLQRGKGGRFDSGAV